MRVIAGTVKGRTLVAPRGRGTRPATDRIRESLFAMLDPLVADTRVLDLFAGAGTLGIEALSRGAAHVRFVERSREALTALRRNIAATGFEKRSDVVAASVPSFLAGGAHGPYDLVFLDPPFADVGGLEASLRESHLRAALAADALVVARVLKKHLPELPPTTRLVRRTDIGEEAILFLKYDGDAAGG